MKLTEAFAYPWVLPAMLVLVPLVWWAWRRPTRRPTMRFSSLSNVPRGHGVRSARLRYVLPVLRSLSVILLVVCIARPRKADEQTRVQTQGVALQLVVDRSGSMRYRDMGGSRGETRMDVVKRTVKSFIEGDGENLKGRKDDLIGLIAFGTYPDTLCPLTWDHSQVLHALKEVYAARDPNEGNTAIGDALLLGIERIRNLNRQFQKEQNFKLTSRALVLLTDGQQNAGKHMPQEAADAAKALGIKIYTIGAAPQIGEDGAMLDDRVLRSVAETTGAKFFRATDASSLLDVYAEIDRMERSTVDEKRYFLYDELAFRWIELGSAKLPPPLAVALGLVVLEQILAATRLRRIP